MIPQQLKQARKQLGKLIGKPKLSQSELATALGMAKTHRNIAYYESGRPIPRHIEVAVKYLLEHPEEI